MRKAYLRHYSANRIKTKQRTDWGGFQAKKENAERMHRKEKPIINLDGFEVGETWERGPVPKDVVRHKMEENNKIMQSDRLQKLKTYNKVVLSDTKESKVTMFFSGGEVFLIEDFPDGTYRQSLQSSSVERMKELFTSKRVPWRE